MTADITFDTTHHAQVEAFADMQRQRDSARRWVVNLESRIARAREIAADNDMNPSVRSLLLAVLDGECEHQWRSHTHLGLHRWFECSECGAKR